MGYWLVKKLGKDFNIPRTQAAPVFWDLVYVAAAIKLGSFKAVDMLPGLPALHFVRVVGLGFAQPRSSNVKKTLGRCRQALSDFVLRA